MDLGGGSLSSCGKYGQIRFFPPAKTLVEFELDRDLDTILAVTDEIEKRFKEFQERKRKNMLEYVKAKKKFAKEIFDEPIKHIINYQE